MHCHASVLHGEGSHGAQECSQRLEKENKTTCICSSEKRNRRLKPAKQTNGSLLFFLANENSFHLADAENQSEWTEKFFDTLICSAHICRTASMLGITVQSYSCTNLSQRSIFISEVTSGELPLVSKIILAIN